MHSCACEASISYPRIQAGPQEECHVRRRGVRVCVDVLAILALAARVFAGCYKDAEPRRLPAKLGTPGSVDECHRLALLNGYAVFGMQYG